MGPGHKDKEKDHKIRFEICGGAVEDKFDVLRVVRIAAGAVSIGLSKGLLQFCNPNRRGKRFGF